MTLLFLLLSLLRLLELELACIRGRAETAAQLEQRAEVAERAEWEAKMRAIAEVDEAERKRREEELAREEKARRARLACTDRTAADRTAPSVQTQAKVCRKNLMNEGVVAVCFCCADPREARLTHPTAVQAKRVHTAANEGEG